MLPVFFADDDDMRARLFEHARNLQLTWNKRSELKTSDWQPRVKRYFWKASEVRLEPFVQDILSQHRVDNVANERGVNGLPVEVDDAR